MDRDGIRVNRSVTIPADELDFKFVPSGGPGGQHANRSATKAILTWDVASSRALGPRQKQRVLAALRSRLDGGGVLRLTSDKHRSQLRNREDVAARLGDLVARALRPVKKRTATKPTEGSRRRRIAEKKRRSDVKRERRRPRADDD